MDKEYKWIMITAIICLTIVGVTCMLSISSCFASEEPYDLGTQHISDDSKRTDICIEVPEAEAEGEKLKETEGECK